MPSKPGQGRGKARPSKARQKALELTARPAPVPDAPVPAIPVDEIDELKESLTFRQLQFCEQYLACGVAAVAARRAGYADGTAARAWQFLSRPEVKLYLEHRKAEMLAEIGLTPRTALLELKAIALSRVTDYRHDEDGLTLVDGAAPEAIGAVSSVKFTRRRLGRGRPHNDPATDPVPVVEEVEYKLWDKGKALERALELLGLVERGSGGGGRGGSNTAPDGEVRGGAGVRVSVTGGPTGVEVEVQAGTEVRTRRTPGT